MIMKHTLLLLILMLFLVPATAEMDCLDYALASGEPVMLIGMHSYFYGPTSINHFVNYEIIDNRTINITDYMHNNSWILGTRCLEEIRLGVYSDGFNYFKLFIYREPQRYWRRMI